MEQEDNGIENFFKKERDICNQYANRDDNLVVEEKGDTNDNTCKQKV